MESNEFGQNSSLEEYRDWEVQLHSELMGSCRKYISRLNMVSIVGIIDLVKREVIELEKAAKKAIPSKEPLNTEEPFTDTTQDSF